MFFLRRRRRSCACVRDQSPFGESVVLVLCCLLISPAANYFQNHTETHSVWGPRDLCRVRGILADRVRPRSGQKEGWGWGEGVGGGGEGRRGATGREWSALRAVGPLRETVFFDDSIVLSVQAQPPSLSLTFTPTLCWVVLVVVEVLFYVHRNQP